MSCWLVELVYKYGVTRFRENFLILIMTQKICQCRYCATKGFMRCNKVLNVMSVSRVLIIYAIKLRFVNEQIPFMEIYKKQNVKQTFCRIRCFLAFNKYNQPYNYFLCIQTIQSMFCRPYTQNRLQPKRVNDRKMCITCNILLTFFADLINNYFNMQVQDYVL